MRKTIVTALVILLVMLAVSCDNIPGLKSADTEDGFVTLSINTGETAGNSRSLTEALAKDNGHSVEIIFRNGTAPSTGPFTYTRKEAMFGQTVHMKIKVGTYGKDDAIVLVGKHNGSGNDYTLLGTGTVTSVNSADVSGDSTFNITSTTTGLTFTLTPLETDLTAGASDAASAGDAVFKIHEDTGSPKIEDNDAFAGLTAQGKNENVAWFQVPMSTSNIKASLTITGFEDTGSVIFRKDSVSLPVKFTHLSANPLAVTVANSLANPITPAVDAEIDGEFSFYFTTPAVLPDHYEQYLITFDIPVYVYGLFVPEVPAVPPNTPNPGDPGSPAVPAQNPGLAGAHNWHIRGGTTPDEADFTGNGNDAVALIVSEEPAGDEVGITITW